MGTPKRRAKSGPKLGIDPSKPLDNLKHEAFAQAVVRGEAPYSAFQTAGYKEHHANAYRLRDSERVAKRIAYLRERIFKRVQRNLDMDVDRLTIELARIGLANITDVLAIKDGQVLVQDTDQVSPDVLAAVAEIRQTKDGIVVKMHDKAAALVNLGRHMGYFKENVQLNVHLSLAELVNMSFREDLPAAKVIEHDGTENAGTENKSGGT